MADSEDTGTPDESALRALEARLRRATETAERLLAQADGVPAGGWRRPTEPDDRRGWEAWISPDDLELLLGALASLRELVPTDLQHRLQEALRELLLALRALVDWLAQRAERHRTAPAEVQDIPIL